MENNIEHESQLRALVRNGSPPAHRPGGARFTEPGRGSTTGLPDVSFGREGVTHYVELKLFEIDSDSANIWGSMFCSFTPAQKRILPAMVDEGLPLWVFGAVKGSRMFWLTRIWRDGEPYGVNFAANIKADTLACRNYSRETFTESDAVVAEVLFSRMFES